MSTKTAMIHWTAANGINLHNTFCLGSSAEMRRAERLLESLHEQGLAYRIEGDLLKCLSAVPLAAQSLMQPEDLKPVKGYRHIPGKN